MAVNMAMQMGFHHPDRTAEYFRPHDPLPATVEIRRRTWLACFQLSTRYVIYLLIDRRLVEILPLCYHYSKFLHDVIADATLRYLPKCPLNFTSNVLVAVLISLYIFSTILRHMDDTGAVN